MAGTADDWLCRRQALPTPDEAQRMDMVPIPEFFSDADIETLLTEVAKVQAAKAAGVLERGANEEPHTGGVWRTTYMHTGGTFQRRLPQLLRFSNGAALVSGAAALVAARADD